MPIKITMPALSPTMEEGNLAKWTVQEGDKVSAGDVIAEIETDKATMEVEAVDDGIMAKIIVPAGATGVKVNSVIAILAGEEESIDAALAGAESITALNIPPLSLGDQPEPQLRDALHNNAPVHKGERVFASPLAQRLAGQNGLDLNTLVGSGPYGRIIKRDVETALLAPTPRQVASAGAPVAVTSDEQNRKLFKEADYEWVAHDSMRKTIAKRLVESKQTVPHFYVTIECELDALLNLRAQLNAAAPLLGDEDSNKRPAYKVSVNDMVIKAAALALKTVPDANVSWLDDGMLRHKHADIGVAVAIENGLITPIIRQAEIKSLSTISNEMKDLVTRARARKLKPQEYQGGTSAVSNLGMYGVKEFSAIINPPHATIFAIGAGTPRPVVKNGTLAVANCMSVTISTDHRAVDGALAAQLAQAFKHSIENPLSMVV
ncbi:pyruvate dehydrogenase complex dihydrolipoamide acetyltransferase [Bartonella sp. DGB2]|uniref:pyruvate dehydrogenase complex dihydrolipoamide acetyltransferase n=1 Tax=Bartonella sp. DGB2 TaxID=3388426 RepID=UPI00398F8F08